MEDRGQRIRALERGVGTLEEAYGMRQSSQEEEEMGGFWQNVVDFYGGEGWGDWWRGLFRRERRSQEPSPTMYPEWGRENIQELRSIMEE